MNKNSFAYSIFSAEKIPAFPRDAVLGIQENNLHPYLTKSSHAEFEAAHSNLLTAIIELEAAHTTLKEQGGIDIQPLRTAYALCNSVKFLLEQTFEVNAARPAIKPKVMHILPDSAVYEPWKSKRPKNGLVKLAVV